MSTFVLTSHTKFLADDFSLSAKINYYNHNMSGRTRLEGFISRVYHNFISRQTVVEIGNLAPKNVGQMRWLITTLSDFLYSAGYKYSVFTLVPGIYNAFKRMNIILGLLAEAKYESLPESIKPKWGPDY